MIFTLLFSVREMSLRLAEDKEDATKTVVVEKMDLDEPEMEDEDEDNELVDEEVEEEDVEEEDVLDDEVKDEDGVEDEVDEEEEEDEEDVESDDEENGEEEVEGKVVDDADVSSDVVDKNAALVQMSDIANIEVTSIVLYVLSFNMFSNMHHVVLIDHHCSSITTAHHQ